MDSSNDATREPTDEWLDQQAAKGELRLREPGNLIVTPIPPNEPKWDGDEVAFMRRQRAVFGGELQRSQLELLRRASILLDYLDNNVGLTEEYPVMLLSDSEATEKDLLHIIKGLRDMVGCLSEVE